MNKVTFATKDLLDALAIAGLVIERRNAIPVLGCIKISVTDSGADIFATDLENYLTISLEHIEASQPFAFIINPKTLRDAARGSDRVSIEIEGEIATITAGDLVIQKRNLIDAEDYPLPNTPDASQQIEIPEAAFAQMIEYVRHTVSTEQTRYYLNGAYFHDAGDGKLTIVSTDGHRLTRYQMEGAWPSGAKSIVPTKVITILSRLTSKKGNKTLEINFHSDLFSTYKIGNVTMHSRCIDGTFPDYTRVIPKPFNPENLAYFKTVLSADALKRIPSSGGMFSRAVKLEPEKGVMTYHDMSNDITAIMPITGVGKEKGFNLAYLIGMASQSGTIKLESYSGGDPAIVTSEDPRLTRVLMPMRV